MLGEAIAAVANEIARVDGVVGVVLGGSRARGDATPASDVDLGIYTSGPRDLDALSRLATRWSGAPVEIGVPGSWGPWVDAGGWLSVDGTAVDWILRDLARLSEMWARAQRGEFAFVAQAGHPLGFLDVAYAGELARGRILSDPTGALAALQTEACVYPTRLRDAMVDALWEADFLVGSASKGISRADAPFVTLCLARALMLCAHALHADAGVWVTNEKGLVPGVTRLPRAPRDFTRRAAEAIETVGAQQDSLSRAIALVGALVTETTHLLSS